MGDKSVHNFFDEIVFFAANSTIEEVDGMHSSKGDAEKFLALSSTVTMRIWKDEQPTQDKPSVTRSYETLGYVIKGKAELYSAGQTVTLQSSASHVVPKETEHTYKILESFIAVGATSPPVQMHG